MKKVCIATVYTGFNYGSCLQAYASQTVIEKMGYNTTLLAYNESLVKGRDIRIKKILGMGIRTIFRPKLFKKTFLTYKNSLKKDINEDVKKYFFEFQKNKLRIQKLKYSDMKKLANENEVIACVCGSDQIWNATNVYIDPIFYLRFAPEYKRIAYAPSLGKSFIPSYNEKIIKKYTNDFNYISVREEEGAKLLGELLNKNIQVVLDPTLLLGKNEWLKTSDVNMKLPKKYMLVYFLDKPTEAALYYIKNYSEKYNLEIISIPYKFDEYSELSNLKYINAGPEQFLNLISKASFVFTDSFHGMVFSANFNTPFYIFQRNYGSAANQSSRITSILDKLDLGNRFINDIYEKDIITRKNIKIEIDVDFSNSNFLLEKERKKSKKYLKDSFEAIEKRVK